MDEKKRQSLRKKLSDVPNPPVPNRAHTEMSIKNYQKNENNKNSNKNDQN